MKVKTIKRKDIAQIIGDLGTLQVNFARYIHTRSLTEKPDLLLFFNSICAATSNLDRAWKGDEVLPQTEMIKRITGEKT